MAKPSVTDDDLKRLRDERQDADRLYNEWLTRVDQALVHPEPLPPPPDPPEQDRLPRLNEVWQVVPAAPVPFTGWRARLGALVWRIVAPIAQRQQEFNSLLVEHLNRQAASEQEARTRAAQSLDATRREFEGLARFQSELIQFLQQITPYVDTKDRDELAVLRRQTEERSIALAAGLSGVSDELLRRWESMVAREQRFSAHVSSLAGTQDELRVTIAGFQRTSQALKRELDRLSGGVAPAAGAAAAPAPASAARPETLGTRLDSDKYVGFEDRFRGSSAEIQARLDDYLPLFDGASNVLDVGCGRGEFLALLAARGVTARGVDINPGMVAHCRARGLDVTEGDALAYLEAQPDDSLGGLLAIQVVEHLQADQLVRLLDVAYHKLRPGSRLALETINPACWYAFFASYIRDITHVHPIHPDTLRYLLVASGFQRVDIRFREPYPELNKLQPVSTADLAKVAPGLAVVGETLNENAAKLNALLFTHLDYAAIGEKI